MAKGITPIMSKTSWTKLVWEKAWTLDRVGFLPEETYFFQDNGRNMVSSVFFHFLPEEMEEWDL